MKERLIQHVSIMAIITGVSAAVSCNAEIPANYAPSFIPMVEPIHFTPRTYLEDGFLKKPLLPETKSATPTPVPALTSTRRLSAISEGKPLKDLTKEEIVNNLQALHNKKEFTVEDSLKALENAHLIVQCVTKYESGSGNKKYGYKSYDPYILDGPNPKSAFNFGIGQLALDGKLIEFYRFGFTNPFDPNQAVSYMNIAIVENRQGWAWSPINRGLC